MKFLKRIILILLLVAVILILGCGLFSPYLLQSIGTRVAGKFGIEWEESEAQGYSSLNLKEVSLAADGFSLNIDTLTVPQPGPWLLSAIGLRNFTHVEAGLVVLDIRESAPNPDQSGGGPIIVDQVKETLLGIAPRLPIVSIDALVVRSIDGVELLRLEELELNGPALSARMPARSSLPGLQLHAQLTEAAIRLAAVTLLSEEPVRLSAEYVSNTESVALQGRLISAGKPLEFKALLEQDRWQVQSLTMEAQEWPVPDFLMPQEGPLSKPPKVNLSARLQGRDFEADLKLMADEVGDRNEALSADFRLSGDMDVINVTSLSIQTSWLTADLSQPVQYHIADRTFSGKATFMSRAVLDGQSLIPATGTVLVEVEFQPDSSSLPSMDFRMTGEDLQYDDLSVSSISLQGSMEYPWLAIDTARIGLADESAIEAVGKLNLDKREIEANGSIHLSPGLLDSFVPQAGIQGPADGQWKSSGPITNLTHSGRIQPVDFQFPGFHDFTADLEWAGQGVASIDVLVNLHSSENGNLHLVAGVQQDKGDGAWKVEIEELLLGKASTPVLELEAPSAAVFDPKARFPLKSLSPITLRSGTRRLSASLDWDQQAVSLEATNLEIQILDPWLLREVPSMLIDDAEITLVQLDPALVGSFSLKLHSEAERLDVLSLSLNGNFADSGIQIESVTGFVAENSFIEGNIQVPLRVSPFNSEAGKRFDFLGKGELSGSLSADITPDIATDFPDVPYLDKLTGTHFDMQLGGTLEAPTGTVEAVLSAFPVGVLDSRLEGYMLENLELMARLGGDQLEISSLTGSIRNATIDVSGNIQAQPLIEYLNRSESDWRPILKQADLQIQLRGFDVESFNSVLPGYLRPTGEISGDLAIKPGPHFTGKVHLQGLSFRPTLYTQTIDKINVILDLDDTRMSLDTATASIGDSAVALAGYFDVGDLKTPLYRLEITGDRTPLVRTPDLLLHADVDLVLDGTESGRAAILSGNLVLRDSVMLMDIDPLAARTAGRSMPKPPFFSIPLEPFAGWELDVKISGDDALRFRSQFAKALLSINMDLDGTMESPVLVGSIFTSNGLIQFPGAQLSLSRSEFFVTRDQQQTLRIDLNSTGRVASYILSMRVSGSVDEPNVEFSSTPSLSNSQIFHLLATGSLERSGGGNIGLYIGKSLLGPGSSESGLLDRLSVQVGRDVSETGENTIDLFFDLTQKVRLHGEYDKYDDQNLNLEWEVYSK